ncbi:hypothetical protein BKA66DRAFT_587806 [Pyrenochaeta sp. MPI-SDFR-AT-0127]|nr:hypothetical protein BKA66DRAFT_587806 [Pyrenochaeta sp. MPI-SDFR-AT-0127]
MKGIYAAIGVISALIQTSCANLDVITLNTGRDTWIQEAEATLVVGNVPNPITGDVALWSAIMMDKKDFLQGVTQNSPSSYYCPNLGRNWCNFAYTLVGSTTPENGKPISAPPGSRIKTHYKLNANTNLWDQNLYLNDKLVSSISSSKGQRGKIFYVSIECASGNCATAPAHSWENISITLNKADQSFGHSGNWEYNATGGKMSTADNGKTWKFTKLSIPDTPAQ